MPPPLVPWQEILLPAVLLWILAGAAVGIAVWLHRNRKNRVTVAALVCAGVALIALSAPIAMSAYHQYVALNTRVYGYDLDVHPNGTGPEAIVVPIPTDEILVSGLRVLSGIANWTVIDTGHGQGLYVAFAGDASLEARYSVSGPTRDNYNHTPTMRENVSGFETYVWVYHATASGIRLDLWIDWCHLSAYPEVGWRTYSVECSPPP